MTSLWHVCITAFALSVVLDLLRTGQKAKKAYQTIRERLQERIVADFDRMSPKESDVVCDRFDD